MEATAIFPHQLFARHPSVRHGRLVFLIEDQRFFGEAGSGILFHKNKLVLHRASMKAYQKLLTASGHSVHYIEHEESESMNYLFDPLMALDVKVLHLTDPVDSTLEKRLTENAKKSGVMLHIEASPAFLTDPAWFRDFFGKSVHYSMTSFYIAQRKRLGIILNKGSLREVGGHSIPITANLYLNLFQFRNLYLQNPIMHM